MDAANFFLVHHDGKPLVRDGAAQFPNRTPIGRVQAARDGAVAQLGERVNGIHEVRGSIPLGSTNVLLGYMKSC